MTELERVMEQCRAHPEDDGPRLVWADLVGGERGELVVLQCDLARGGLSPREIAVRRARERELLAAHGAAWAGALASAATRWTFRRGFVEFARLDLDACEPGVLAEHPLLDALAVSRWIGQLDKLPRLRGLVLETRGGYPPGVYPDMRAVARGLEAAVQEGAIDVRALGFDQLTPAMAAPLSRLLRGGEIGQLWLRSCDLAERELADLFAAGRHLVGLDFQWRYNTHVDVLAPLSLVALRLCATTAHELARLAMPVDRLGVRTIDPVGAIAFDVRALELLGTAVPSALEALLASPPARLRELTVDAVVPDELLARVIDRFAPQLESLAARNALPALPCDAVQLPDDPRPPMRHAYGPLATPAFDDAGSVCRLAAPLVVEHGERRWEFPRRSVDAPITLGRNSYDDIVIPALGEVTAGLYYQPHGWELHTYRTGHHVTVPAGAVAQLGPVALRFSS